METRGSRGWGRAWMDLQQKNVIAVFGSTHALPLPWLCLPFTLFFFCPTSSFWNLLWDLFEIVSLTHTTVLSYASFFWNEYCGWVQEERKISTGSIAGSTPIDWVEDQWHIRFRKWAGANYLGLKLQWLLSKIYPQKHVNSRGTQPPLHSTWAGWCFSVHSRGWKIKGSMLPKWIANKSVLCMKEIFCTGLSFQFLFLFPILSRFVYTNSCNAFGV